MRSYSRRRLVSPDKGSLSSGTDYARLLAWVACGQASRAALDGPVFLSVGAADALSAPLEEAGANVRALEQWALEVFSSCPSQTAEAVARVCWEAVASMRASVVALAQEHDTSGLRMVEATRGERLRLQLLRRLVDECGRNPVLLVDRICSMHEEESLLLRESHFTLELLASVLEPLCRSAAQLMTHGQMTGEDRDGFFACGSACPEVLQPHKERLLCVARTVDLLYRMDERVEREEEAEKEDEEQEGADVARMVCRMDALYSRECRRLVLLLLHDKGGLRVAKKMRESFGRLPGVVEWPLADVLCSEKVRSNLMAVGAFVESLQQSREEVSRLKLCGNAVFVRFRQKALHVLSTLFNSIIALRLNHDLSWEEWRPVLENCSDFEQLRRTQEDLVQRLSDVCLQNEASRPLRKAVEQAIVSCNDFALSDGEHWLQIETLFDASVALFRRLIAGMLQQRKIPHLMGLQTALDFNAPFVPDNEI